MRWTSLPSSLRIAVACLLTVAVAQAQGRASLVNPFVGTANGGNFFPGATMPFGMVLQFSPEATPVNPRRPIAASGGYEYRADRIRGFSVTKVEGWGCAGGSGDVPPHAPESTSSSTTTREHPL